MRTNRRYTATPLLNEWFAHALYWLWTHGEEVFLMVLVVVAVVMGYVAVTR